MKIDFRKVGERYIEISVLPINYPDGFEKVIYEILIYIFHNKPLYILTLSPKKYSLGYELLEKPTKIKLGKVELLANYITSCSENILQKIVESEEFERGLIRLVTIDTNKLQEAIGNVFFQFFNDNDIIKSNFKYQLVSREADGKMLCWFNPIYPIHDIEIKLKSIIDSANSDEKH